MKIKTSASDPISVDYLPQHLLRCSGRIGLTFAPGKKAPGVSAIWERDLHTDLTRLSEVYRTNILVSLVEDFELAQLHIADLVTNAASEIDVRRFPFPDGGVPESRDAANAIVTTILDAVRGGRNVVIHCRGGLGRTGLVAACCLVALGHALPAAITAVRAARPGAIETRRQEEFIERFAETRQVRTAIDPGRRQPDASRFQGCLLGGALGDALGYPIELESTASILARRGSGALEHLTPRKATVAQVSDETQMTLFVAEGIIRGVQRWQSRGVCAMEGSIQRALVRWYATQTKLPLEGAWGRDPGWLALDARLHSQRAPRSTCMRSLAAQVRLADTPTVARPPNDSHDCGAVVRSAPIGLAATSREVAFQLARDSGVLTHGHPSAYLSAAYFASLIYDVSRGAALPAAMDLAAAALEAEECSAEVMRVDAAVRALAKRPPTPEVIDTLGSGSTAEEAVGIALLCALTADGSTPRGVAEALWRSVAHGGDSDSTGSLTGNLLGAMHGVDGLPSRWIAEVELRDVVMRVADDLYAAAALDTKLDFDSYPPN